MLKFVTAVAFAIALPAVVQAEPAQPVAKAGPSKTCPMDHSKMSGMDHSKMAGMDMSNMDHSKMSGMDMSKMDHSKMMAGCDKPAQPATSTDHQGHSGH